MKYLQISADGCVRGRGSGGRLAKSTSRSLARVTQSDKHCQAASAERLPPRRNSHSSRRSRPSAPARSPAASYTTAGGVTSPCSRHHSQPSTERGRIRTVDRYTQREFVSPPVSQITRRQGDSIIRRRSGKNEMMSLGISQEWRNTENVYHLWQQQKNKSAKTARDIAIFSSGDNTWCLLYLAFSAQC